MIADKRYGTLSQWMRDKEHFTNEEVQALCLVWSATLKDTELTDHVDLILVRDLLDHNLLRLSDHKRRFSITRKGLRQLSEEFMRISKGGLYG